MHARPDALPGHQEGGHGWGGGYFIPIPKTTGGVLHSTSGTALPSTSNHLFLQPLPQGLLGALPQPGSRFPEFPEFNAGDILEESEICYR